MVLESQAEAVVLVSDKPNDSEVLLVSFELEQMLAEMTPGAHVPKVCVSVVARTQTRLSFFDSIHSGDDDINSGPSICVNPVSSEDFSYKQNKTAAVMV